MSRISNIFPHRVPLDAVYAIAVVVPALLNRSVCLGTLLNLEQFYFPPCRPALKAAVRDMRRDGKQSVRLCTGQPYYYLIFFTFQNNIEQKVNIFVTSLLMKGPEIIEVLALFMHIYICFNDQYQNEHFQVIGSRFSINSYPKYCTLNTITISFVLYLKKRHR